MRAKKLAYGEALCEVHITAVKVTLPVVFLFFIAIDFRETGRDREIERETSISEKNIDGLPPLYAP